MNERNILLSGANGGIGKAILKELIDAQYNVFALDIFDNNIKDLKCHFIRCDVTNKEDLTNAYTKINSFTDNLYAIINTVGIFKMESIIEGSEDDFHKILNINFFGIYSLNKIMFPLLKDNSRIINLTSELVRYSPQPFQGYYNLSKIILDSYSDVLRREANYLSIKVIKLQSGSMKTGMLNKASNEYDAMVNESKHFKKPLTKLKYMMDREIKKQNDPSIISHKIIKILQKKKPKMVYRIKNSPLLFIMGHLPEKLQDKIYKRVIK